MKKIFLSILFCIGILVIMISNQSVFADNLAQQPTLALATVTGTPEGVTATVNLNSPDAINVRSGPNSLYGLVGQLQPGQTVPVFGRSKGGEWLYIEYFGGPENRGWVYSPLVEITAGELPIKEPPPDPTPEVTQTINPTLAAQFITTAVPTRLPTYTPATPLVVATYQDASNVTLLGGIPMGLVIFVLGGLGGLLALFSYIQAR